MANDNNKTKIIKDLRNYDTKAVGITTKRQTIYFGIAAIFLIPGVIDFSTAFFKGRFSGMGLVLILLSLPIVFLGLIDRIGRTSTEMFIARIIYTLILTPQKRKRVCVNEYKEGYERIKKAYVKKEYKKLSPAEKAEYKAFLKNGVMKTSKKHPIYK